MSFCANNCTTKSLLCDTLLDRILDDEPDALASDSARLGDSRT